MPREEKFLRGDLASLVQACMEGHGYPWRKLSSLEVGLVARAVNVGVEEHATINKPAADALQQTFRDQGPLNGLKQYGRHRVLGRTALPSQGTRN